MGVQKNITREAKKEEAKLTALQVANNIFKLEVTFLESYYGYRVAGELKYKPEGILPRIELESLNFKRWSEFKANIKEVRATDLKALGYGEFEAPLPPHQSEKLLWLIPGQRRAQFKEKYERLCLKRNKNYLCYIGQDRGLILAAVDVVELSMNDRRILLNKYFKQNVPTTTANTDISKTSKLSPAGNENSTETDNNNSAEQGKENISNQENPKEGVQENNQSGTDTPPNPQVDK